MRAWSVLRKARLLLLALALVATGPAGLAGGAPPAKERPPGEPSSHLLTLITGDRVYLEVFPNGRQAATVDPVPRGPGLPEPAFQTLEVEGDLYVIPSDAAPYLDDKLDRELFNVTALVEQGLAGRGASALPVIVDYQRAPGPPPSPFTVEDTLESIAAVAAREPRGKARAFGRALARQAGEDARRKGPKPAWAVDPDHLFRGIRKIWLDQEVEAALEDSVPQIGAPTAWEAGYDGAGVTVAVLDTGVDAAHPDLTGKVAATRNFTDSPTETDRYGHGTHVASTAAGSGAASDGLRSGVAPGATIISGKVLGDTGSGQTSWIIAGMEWAARDRGADVVNLSLGSGPSDGTDPLSQAVNNLTAETGTLFAIAAGNSGPGDQTVTSPGAAASALTVGAVSKFNALARFSSRGPRLGDFAIKPDLTAPGVGIVAARAEGTSRGIRVGEHYTRLSGTSMATPHAAGAAALLAQRYPGWDAAELKAALVTTASPGPYTVYQQGGGRVDLARQFTQPTVLAAPAPLDLGYFPWPHEESDPVTKTVTYTNVSDAELTLDLTLDVADEDGNPAAPGMLTVSPQSVTLASGASQNVEVTLETTAGDTGLYGGYLLAQDRIAEVVVRSPVGFYKEPERYDLTVVGIGRDGGPPAVGSSFVVMEAEDSRNFFDVAALRSQPARYRLPPGTYSVMGYALGANENGGIESAALVGNPEVVLDRDITLTLDAREAQEITVETSRPAQPEFVTLTYHRADTVGGAVTHRYQLGASFDAAYAQASAPVTVGAFEHYSRWELVSPRRPGTYAYDLVFVEPDRIPAGLSYAPDRKQLAAVTNHYFSHTEGHSRGFLRHKWRPYEPISVDILRPLGVPLTRVEYISAGDTLWQQRLWAAFPYVGIMIEPTLYYGPGQRIEQTWYKQPFGPKLLEGTDVHRQAPIYRRGNRIIVYRGLGDAQGHFASPDQGIDETDLRLYRNGVEIPYDPDWFQESFVVPAERSRYTLAYDTARSAEWWRQSVRTHTEWTFFSELVEDDQTLPLMLIDYELELDQLNRAVAPGVYDLRLGVHHQRSSAASPIEHLKLWTSFDDGASWQAADVHLTGNGRFTARLVHPPIARTSGYVSLRVHAEDDAGNEVLQEIMRAYAITPRQNLRDPREFQAAES